MTTGQNRELFVILRVLIYFQETNNFRKSTFAKFDGRTGDVISRIRFGDKAANGQTTEKDDRREGIVRGLFSEEDEGITNGLGSVPLRRRPFPP